VDAMVLQRCEDGLSVEIEHEDEEVAKSNRKPQHLNNIRDLHSEVSITIRCLRYFDIIRAFARSALFTPSLPYPSVPLLLNAAHKAA